MRIAYVSTDEGDQAVAIGMAAECGAVVSAFVPNDRPPGVLFDAVLYNLDDLPGDKRSALVERLRLGKSDRPTAVHGYNLTDEQARDLVRNGVAAMRRLHPRLIRSLLTAARRYRESVPRDDAGTELTWIDLVG